MSGKDVVDKLSSRDRGKKIPSRAELFSALGKIEGFAKKVRQKMAVVGGLAMQVWGSVRLTGDLDVISGSTLGQKGKPLSFGGVRLRVQGLPTDIIVRTDDFRSLYEEALKRAVHVQGVPAKVVLPEHLAAMKMVAGRPKDEEDLMFLLSQKGFDYPLAEKIAKKHLGAYAAKELRGLRLEAEWRARRTRKEDR
jgi:hypothetical protein